MKRDLAVSQWKLLVSSLSDAQLLEATRTCVSSERERTAWLVAHLAEVFRRDLALQRGYPSIYKYAREELRLSESQAWERVSAARLALEIPETIERIANGDLTLDSAGALWRAMQEKKPVAPAVHAMQGELMGAPAKLSIEDAKPIRKSDKREMFTRVLGKSRRESEVALKEWKEERGLERRGPEKSRPKTHMISFELTDEEVEQFNRLRDLLSHKLNARDPKAAFRWMVENGLEKVDPVRKAERIQKRRARSAGVRDVRANDDKTTGGDAVFLARRETAQQDSMNSRSETAGPTERSEALSKRLPAPRKSDCLREAIPASLKRAVWGRDGGRCQFRDPQSGRTCGATAFLDLDHVLEVRNGGRNTFENLRLVCRAHNRRRHLWE